MDALEQQAGPLAAIQKQIAEVPDGAPEHRALVMLMDLNAEQHRQLSQLAATVTGLQKDLAALKAPKAREQHALKDTCMDVVEWLYKIKGEEAAGIALVFKISKDGAVENFNVSCCAGELIGAWMLTMGRARPVLPFWVRGHPLDEGGEYPSCVTWASSEEFGQEALRRLLCPPTGWVLEKVYMTEGYDGNEVNSDCLWVRGSS